MPHTARPTSILTPKPTKPQPRFGFGRHSAGSPAPASDAGIFSAEGRQRAAQALGPRSLAGESKAPFLQAQKRWVWQLTDASWLYGSFKVRLEGQSSKLQLAMAVKTRITVAKVADSWQVFCFWHGETAFCARFGLVSFPEAFPSRMPTQW